MSGLSRQESNGLLRLRVVATVHASTVASPATSRANAPKNVKNEEVLVLALTREEEGAMTEEEEVATELLNMLEKEGVETTGMETGAKRSTKRERRRRRRRKRRRRRRKRNETGREVEV